MKTGGAGRCFFKRTLDGQKGTWRHCVPRGLRRQAPNGSGFRPPTTFSCSEDVPREFAHLVPRPLHDHLEGPGSREEALSDTGFCCTEYFGRSPTLGLFKLTPLLLFITHVYETVDIAFPLRFGSSVSRVLVSTSNHDWSTEVQVLFENMTFTWKFYLEKGVERFITSGFISI